LDIVALIGTAAGVISVVVGIPIAYKQLQVAQSDSRRKARVDQLTELLDEPALFAPQARYLGFDVDLIDRQEESASLMRLVRTKSVIGLEGIPGAGKTSLAAHVCRHIGRGWDVRWVFCDERSAALTLSTLAKALVARDDSPAATAVLAVVARGSDPAETADALIAWLAGRRTLLVLDNFHAVSDAGVRQLLERLEHSEIASSVIVTSRSRLQFLHAVPLTERLEVHGLSLDDSRVLLRHREVTLRYETAKTVWERAGDGNPLALILFAGRARDSDPEELALNLPNDTQDLSGWIALAFGDLRTESKWVAKIIAFAYSPVSRDVVRAIAAPITADGPLADLSSRFLVREIAGRFEMHNAVSDYITAQTTPAEQTDLAARFTDYYQGHARAVFLDGLGNDEPSYGLLYLDSFPDYFTETNRHIRFVDDLLERLDDNGYHLARGSKILVLGSGDGTHDPGFAKHGLDVTNLEIQPEIVERGKKKAASLPAEIRYVVADMTKPLPVEIAPGSMDAVFNIGSSFGYENTDRENAAVFRCAAQSLREGAPFVFEYVNGPHWENKRVQRQVDVTQLPNGSTRTEVSIANPEARAALTMISLRRADGTTGWFRHFMHYYRLGEVVDMMADAGLEVVAVYGAKSGRVTGAPFDERQSEAMVVIAVREAS
jgi:SAM-dependent methyltransferase